MKIFFRLLLAGSVAANIFLVSSRLDTDPTRDSTTRAPVATHAPDSAAVISGQGASAERTKAATLVELERAAFAPARRAAQAYWSTQGSFELDYVQSVQAANARVRAELVRIYGPDAASDPLFWRVFRPMDPMYSFLSSAQQVAVQRLKLDRDQRLHDARKTASPDGTPMLPEADVAQRAAESYAAALAGLLDEDERFELALRDSPTAQHLRDAGLSLTEREFREAFRALDRMQRSEAGIDDVIAARGQLRALLGDRRFASLWSTRDPMFARLEAVARKHALDDASVSSLYVVINDFQDERLQAARHAGLDPQRAAETSRAIDRDERNELQRIVGAEIAAEILRARAIDSARLFRGAPTGR